MLEQKLGSIRADSSRVPVFLDNFTVIDVVDFDSILQVHVKLILYSTHTNYCSVRFELLALAIFCFLFLVRVILVRAFIISCDVLAITL